VDSCRYEVEDCAVVHRYRWTGVVRQNKHRAMEWRFVAPPASPCPVGPGAPNGAEHVPADDPGTKIIEPPRSEIVIDPTCAAFLSMHPPPGASGNQPVVQGLTADAERIVNALIRTRSVAVNRDGEVLNPDSGHLQASIWMTPEWDELMTQSVAASLSGSVVVMRHIVVIDIVMCMSDKSNRYGS
jgi:hypothetical protein